MLYVYGTVIQQCRQLMNQNPKMKMKEARAIVTAKQTMRISSGKPHYGKQAAARNLKHKANGTHGL